MNTDFDCAHYDVGVSNGWGPLALGNLKGVNLTLQFCLGQGLVYISTQLIEISVVLLLTTSFDGTEDNMKDVFWLNCLALRSKWLIVQLRSCQINLLWKLFTLVTQINAPPSILSFDNTMSRIYFIYSFPYWI